MGKSVKYNHEYEDLTVFTGNGNEMDVTFSFSSKHVNNKESFYVRSYLHLSLALLKSSTPHISVNTVLEGYYSMKNLTPKFLYNFNKNILKNNYVLYTFIESSFSYCIWMTAFSLEQFTT